MSSRNDIHCPSRIIPADYKFVGITTSRNARLLYIPAVRQMSARIDTHMGQTKGAMSTHEHGGNCMVCGARCLYMAVYHHEKSNEYIATGMDCAEKMGIGDEREFRIFHDIIDAARHHAAGKRKAQGVLQEKGMSAAWTIFMKVSELPAMESQFCKDLNDETTRLIFADWLDDQGENARAELLRRNNYVPSNHTQTFPRSEQTIADIIGKLVKYGSISTAQERYVRNLLTSIEQRDNPPPVPVVVEEIKAVPQEPRTFTAQSSRGVQTVVSTLTDREATNMCRAMTGNNFAQDLSRSGNPSSKQLAWIHILANQEIVRKQEETTLFNQSEAVVTNENQMEGVIELFTKAKEHLKFPKIRIVVGTKGNYRYYRLQLAGERSRWAGWLRVTMENNERTLIGHINPGDGILAPYRAGILAEHPGLCNRLMELAINPAKVAAEYGRLLGNCCFCDIALSDERSTEVGYGPICAKNWGLKWGNKEGKTIAPVCTAV